MARPQFPTKKSAEVFLKQSGWWRSKRDGRWRNRYVGGAFHLSTAVKKQEDISRKRQRNNNPHGASSNHAGGYAGDHVHYDFPQKAAMGIRVIPFEDVPRHQTRFRAEMAVSNELMENVGPEYLRKHLANHLSEALVDAFKGMTEGADKTKREYEKLTREMRNVGIPTPPSDTPALDRLDRQIAEVCRA